MSTVGMTSKDFVIKRPEFERLKAKLDREIAAQEELLRLLDDRESLVALVEKYEQKWPEIGYVKGGSRARKAMELVLTGRVQAQGNDAYGNDLWLVNGHRCSKKGGWCECQDRVRTDPTYGKLCMHRLAVALKTNWMGDQSPKLLQELSQIIEWVGQDEVDLLVDRTYSWNGEGERAALAGYRTPDRRMVHYSAIDDRRIEFSITQFQWALGELGWSLADLPQKLPGFFFYMYPIQRGAGIDCTPNIFYHKGRTPQMIERERSRKMILRDIAAHLPELLKAPFPVNLSNYEAKRVMQLRYEMEREERTAREVWESLPEELQIAIIENA